MAPVTIKNNETPVNTRFVDAPGGSTVGMIFFGIVGVGVNVTVRVSVAVGVAVGDKVFPIVGVGLLVGVVVKVTVCLVGVGDFVTVIVADGVAI